MPEQAATAQAGAPQAGAPQATTRAGTAAGAAGRYIDDRLNAASFFRRSVNKVFPDHWSFMLGEIALYSFMILLITGTYLTFFFNDSPAPIVYHGSYLPLRGVTMSQAYASTLNISFDVRAGLVIRQIHHWAALLFVASIVVHLCRVFFTGAFRKPREINWHIGVGLLVLGILEGFAGYSLPDDLLSGTGLRIAYSVILSVPVVGTWVAYFLFGGPYPGTAIIERLYVIHILLVPGILLALISAHMGILWHQKHTQFPGPGRTENNVVGERLFPVYAAKAGGFFLIVFGVLALLGGLVQINPVWLYGPYDAARVSAGSQPDWYIGFLEGSLRLMPNWEFRGLGHDIPFNIFIPAVILPGLMFTVLAIYPFLESKFTGDKEYHHLLQRPRDAPTRTGLGVGALSFYLVLLIAGGNDIIASIFHISLNALTWELRFLLFALPPISYKLTKRFCIALAKKEREEHHHGYETGVIRRLPSGEYVEVHAPLPVSGMPVLTPVQPEHGGSRAIGAGPDGGPGAELAPHGAEVEPALAGSPAGHEGRSAPRGVSGFFFKREDSEQ